MKQKGTIGNTSLLGALAWGAIWNLGITLALAAVLAKLADKEVIAESGFGYGVMILLLTASWVGAKAAACKIEGRRLIVCLGSGAVYFVILLSITVLFFGGKFNAVGVTALLILCGSVLATLTGTRDNRAGKRRKMKIPNR